MAIAHVQSGGNFANNTTAVTRSVGSVTAGSLIVVTGMKYSPTTDAFAAGDVTQSAGTATIGTVSLDRGHNLDLGGAIGFASTGIWSAIVTGSGTLTMQVGGALAGSYLLIAAGEFSGSWDASRVENVNSGGSATNGQTSFSSGTAATAGAGLFVGCLQYSCSTTQTNTPDAAFTEMYSNEAGTTDDTGSAGYRIVSSATTDAWDGTMQSANDGWAAAVVAYKEAAAATATLSSATPSGTLGTSTSATLGATTDVTSGTFYGVVDSAGNISGITAAQVKAGQNNASAAPVASGNASVSTVAPSVGVTGLTAATLYSYAVVQNSAGGDSNVLTGTFTTAAAASNPNFRNFGPQGPLKTLLTM
jgi:hypothetical protein